jgi:hypothetical protein
MKKENHKKRQKKRALYPSSSTHPSLFSFLSSLTLSIRTDKETVAHKTPTVHYPKGSSTAAALSKKCAHADADHVDVPGDGAFAPRRARPAMLQPRPPDLLYWPPRRGGGGGEEAEPVAGPVRRRSRRGVRLPGRVLRREAGGGPAAARGPGQPVRLPPVPAGLQPGAGQPRVQGARGRAPRLLRRVRRRLRERALLPRRADAQGPVPRRARRRHRVREGEAGLRDVQEREVRQRLRP